MERGAYHASNKEHVYYRIGDAVDFNASSV